MRRPMSASIHSTYRSLFQPMPGEDHREVHLSRRERNRRALAYRDNLIFNPLRRPRDRLYQELAERHRAARARALGSTELKLGREEKPIRCTVLDTDGGSYQSSTGVKNVCTDDSTVYCSYKRNNVNIIFQHAIESAPFELTRIVIKTPSAGYSSPVREGLVYISMSPIEFKDTERYDRPEKDENTEPSLFDNFGVNCVEGRRGSTAARKDASPSGTNLHVTPCIPIIPSWGTKDSHKRDETDPVAAFQIARNSNSTEIVFDPPMFSALSNPSLTRRTGRFVLMKLFNNVHGEQTEKEIPDRPIPLERPPEPQPRPVVTPNPLRDDIPPVGDPLRFDMIDDELEETDSAFPFGDLQEGNADFENVDVQAILFYGHTGRRCFPSVKAL